jgi:type II secretory pathway pseudopilin PulG
MALAELLVAAAIAALVMASLAGVLEGVRQTDTQLSGRALLQRDARLALARMATMVEGSPRLLVPLETTSGTRDVLAVALPARPRPGRRWFCRCRQRPQRHARR